MKRIYLLRLFCLLLMGILCLSLSACGGEEVASDAPSQGASSQTDSSSDSSDPADDENYLVRQRIRSVEYGLHGTSVETSDASVARGSVTKDYLTVQGYASGSAVLTVTDWFGFQATVNVTVDGDAKKIDCEVLSTDDDKFLEVCTDFGARGGTGDDTNAFQRAVDSAKAGETVYVYPGRYNVSLLVMREGVTLKMYTTMTDAKAGYTKEVASDFGSRIAVLSGTRIMNNSNGSSGSKGSSNFAIVGGAIDINHSGSGPLIFGCAENVRLDSVIFKDITNNHVLQVTGSSNMVINNCIFAGFTCGEAFTREVVQVEPSTPGATGGPLTFKEGEYNCPKDVTISNCYFGKSDEAGAPLIAIGHHSRVGEANVTNFKIVDNVFDECLHAAIRYNNIVNTEITGNTFISTAAYKNATQYEEAKDPALILLYHQNGKTSYKAEDGTTVIRASSQEQAGLHGVIIEDNTFILGEGSDKQVLRCVMGDGVPGATYYSNQRRQDTYLGEIYTLNGYRVNQNYASDLSFCNNTIRIEGKPAYKTRYISIEGVYGVEFENNTVDLANGVTFLDGSSGYGAGQVVRPASDTFVLNFAKSNRTITFVYGSDTLSFVPTGSGTLVLNPGKGGYVTADADREGNLTVTVVADFGYHLAGVTDAKGNPVSLENPPIGNNMVFNLIFEC